MPYMIKPILIVLLSTGAAFFIGHRLTQPVLESTVTSAQPVANDGSVHYRGSLTAKVVLVEYGDYECPPCAFYSPIIDAILQRYGNNVRVEFRHFPLPRHPNALKAAMAAEAAGRQGRYWEMHDMLLGSQSKWAGVDNAEQEFGKFAASIGIDVPRFLEALNDPEIHQHVMNDIAQAQQIQVQAVPTFLLNGRQIERAPNTKEGFFAVIDAQLAAEK